MKSFISWYMVLSRISDTRSKQWQVCNSPCWSFFSKIGRTSAILSSSGKFLYLIDKWYLLQVEGESLVIHERWISTADFKILTDISLLGVALEPSKFFPYYIFWDSFKWNLFISHINVCLILCTRGWLSDHDRISNDSAKRNYFFMLRQFMTSWNLEFYNLDLNIYIWISREQKEHLKWNKKTLFLVSKRP